jgi:adenylyltransferase/sulfurtransferase
VVVDATDNVATRYLLNDACVLLRIPLVSGGALGMDGQITVYNHEGGPCYRCIFPTPPPPETVGNCSDNGIIGAITGVIGSLQALEVLKIVTGKQASLQGKLIVFSGTQSSFRAVKLRPKRLDCCVCGVNPSITQLIDYAQFCGAGPHDKALDLKVLKIEERINVKEYKRILDEGVPHVMLDVREEIQFEICSFPDAISK